MNISVIIPTYHRPSYVKRCIESLLAQQPRPAQIIVIDASQDSDTRDVVTAYADVVYIHNEKGRGNTPNSRNVALHVCTGDIVAFLDDDAFVHPGWARNLLDTYADPTVGGVGGRALNHVQGEDTIGVNEIGRLKPNGFLTGNFAADPGHIVDVDHMIGCNMSLRRELMARLGGFKDEYPAGPFGICEETELCVRAKRLGARLVFNPLVCADHIGAPQPGGRRFSPKYAYYHTRNVVVMLLRNYGAGAVVLRHIGALAAYLVRDTVRRLAAATAYGAATIGGCVVGLLVGTRLAVGRGVDPVRRDPTGRAISLALGQPGESRPIHGSLPEGPPCRPAAGD